MDGKHKKMDKWINKQLKWMNRQANQQMDEWMNKPAKWMIKWPNQENGRVNGKTNKIDKYKNNLKNE